VQTGLDKIRLYALHAGEEMIADEDAPRGTRMRCPPSNPEGVFIEVGKYLNTELTPGGCINLQCSWEASLSRLSRGVFVTEAFDV
jgi:hypothetical protein